MNKGSEVCLVLGSNSFAGATIVNSLLSQGYRVLGVSRSNRSNPTNLIYKNNQQIHNFEFSEININTDLPKLISICESYQPRIICDFAGQGMVAESWSEPAQWYQTNIVSKLKFLEYLKNKEWLTKYVRASTPEVYGSNLDPVTENARLNPSSPYAVTHASIDLTLLAYFKQYGFPVTIGRFSNFYGPGQQMYRLIPRVIMSILAQKKMPLHGGGSSERSFLFSHDISNSYSGLIHRGRSGEVYNFSGIDCFTIKRVVELIAGKFNLELSDVADVSPDRPGKDQKYLMSAEKAKNELGWEQTYSLDLGISETIRWTEKHFKQLEFLPSQYLHKP